MIIKVLGPEISLASQNSVNSATLVRIFNTGATATCNVAYANSTVYGNVSISNTESVVLQKTASDLLAGANMKAVPIAYKY